MPAPGEQHKNSLVATNPFEEPQNRVSEYTAQEIATLQSRLNKQLGPEYISARAGPSGGKVHYIAAEKCIQLANEVFGFNGWSSSIREVQVDYVEEIPHSGKFNMGISVIMRVVLRDGTFHEDIGYGHIENCKSKAMGFEKTKKEATTDALKRALRNFGNVLGNCIYDKDYISKVTKMRVAPTKFDVDGLHRHSDHAPVKKEAAIEDGSRTSGETSTSTELIEADEFDGGDFDEADFGVAEVGHPDEVSVEGSTASGSVSRKGSPAKNLPNSALQRTASGNPNPRPPPPRGPAKIPPLGPTPMIEPPNPLAPGTFLQQQSVPNPPNGAQRQLLPPPPPPQPPPQALPPQSSRPPLQQSRSLPQQANSAAGPVTPRRPGQTTNANEPPNNNGSAILADPSVPANVPIGFFAARAAETIQAAPATLPDSVKFNPYSESPSIPKTAGFDHTKSKPVQANREGPVNTSAQSNGQQQHPPSANQNSKQASVGGAGMPAAGSRPNFVNPHLDSARRIGMPNAASPGHLPNRNSYKPPTLKRPADGPAGGNTTPAQEPQQRAALADVTGASTNMPSAAPNQSMPPEKRQRVGPGVPVGQTPPGGGNAVAS